MTGESLELKHGVDGYQLHIRNSIIGTGEGQRMSGNSDEKLSFYQRFPRLHGVIGN